MILSVEELVFFFFLKSKLGKVTSTPLIPVLRRERQVDL